MPRQSFIVLELVFRKLEKTITAAFLCRVRVSEHLWESWDVDMSVEQHGYDCSYALARESPPVTLREGALKKGSWLVQGFAYTFVCNSAGSGPSDPMSALEGAPGCVGAVRCALCAVRGGCAILSYFHWSVDVTSKRKPGPPSLRAPGAGGKLITAVYKVNRQDKTQDKTRQDKCRGYPDLTHTY